MIAGVGQTELKAMTRRDQTLHPREPPAPVQVSVPVGLYLVAPLLARGKQLQHVEHPEDNKLDEWPAAEAPGSRRSRHQGRRGNAASRMSEL